jgi:hypothetical protein
MSKNASTKKSNKKSSTPKAAATKTAKVAAPGRPGRPHYVPKFPRKTEWTMNDFCVANDVDPESGKNINPKGSGKGCSRLTLIKWMARDKARKSKSLVKRLDHTAPPMSENGLGRKAFLFSLREKLNHVAPTPEETAPAASPEIVDVSSETSSYEEQKAALLGTPTPVMDITTPEPDETPVMPEPEMVPAS